MKKILSISLALLAFAACTKEMETTEQGTPINFFSTVSQTKSANVNLQKVQLAQDVQVGVFVKGEDGYVSGGDNACLTADGNGGFSGTSLYCPSDGSAVSVYAYAPFQAAFSGKDDQAVAFSVAADQSTDAGYLKSDLLCGAPSGTNSFTKDNPVVLLSFAHKLAKMTVKFTLSDDTDVDLKGATVNIVNTLPTTSLQVSSGTLGAASGTAAAIKAVTFSTAATSFLASAVIVPQTVAAGDFIQILLADKMLNAKLNSDATFVSGKAYTYNVRISGEGVDASAEIELSSTVTDWDENTEELTGDVTEEELPEPEPVTLTANFGTPGSNATYSAPTYTWIGSTSNLMTVFEFANGELAQYHTLQFTFSNLVDGPVRMGYYVGTTFTEFGSGYYSAGTKTVDLTALGIDLSTVTKISFGGRSNAGSCDILASDVILIGNADGSTPDDGGDTPADGNTLNATFGTPGSKASWDASTNTYSWTAGDTNLMECFSFTNGELADYATLSFTLAGLASDNSQGVRVGYYVGTAWTEIQSFYSNGAKTITLSDKISADVLPTVVKISFGGKSGSGGSVVLTDMKLTK